MEMKEQRGPSTSPAIVKIALFSLIRHQNRSESRLSRNLRSCWGSSALHPWQQCTPFPEIVEFTKQGEFVKELSVDPAQGGSFGLAVSSTADQAIFAAVDDNTSMLTIWTLNLE
jgi:hypothetical protein